MEIRGGIELPARRENVELETSDGLTLVGELSLPELAPPVATLVALHPLPTAGGFMDSHIIRKAAARLPALADIAVLRFNFRGVTSPRGTSGGEFGHGLDEQHDLAAAMDLVQSRGLPHPWIVGWSFGTEVALKWGLEHPIEGAILLSPPLHRTTPAELAAWAGSGKRLVAVIPELDDYLRPAQAAERFAAVPETEFVAVEGGKHLWVGEEQTYRVLTEIVARLNPGVLPLPRTWEG
ncbi:MAG: alpha/beta hydrolase [Actinobacteria bacterium]|nr:alpha/beta hydrolase [Actinomycetota bacterium]